MLIARGKRQMETAFPKRFTGGFSPPFDALPAWLPAMWHSLGGTFVSCLYTNSDARCASAGQASGSRHLGLERWIARSAAIG